MNAYIFDVDGVITNPGLKKVEQTAIVDKIIEKLEQKQIVAINTGRSLAWVLERVINPLIKLVSDKSILSNFFAVGEKGGTWITFNNQGQIERHKDNAISVPELLQTEIKSLIENKFPKSMFYDDSKETMISTEMLDGFSISEFGNLQKKLVELMKQILKKYGFENNLKIDPSTIATDIENKHVGKDFAVDRILEWIKQKNVEPEKFIAFGDSMSDIPMAERLFEHGLKVELIFVGKNNLNLQFKFPVTITQEKFDKGTLEYLTKPV